MKQICVIILENQISIYLGPLKAFKPQTFALCQINKQIKLDFDRKKKTGMFFDTEVKRVRCFHAGNVRRLRLYLLLQGGETGSSTLIMNNECVMS